MEDDSLVLKGLTGSVLLIGATLVAVPGGSAESGTEYGLNGNGLADTDLAGLNLAEQSKTQLEVAAKPQSKTRSERDGTEELEVLDLEQKEIQELKVTEGIETGEYRVEMTDTGEEAVYLTVRDEEEIVHDKAYEEGETLEYRDLHVEVEDFDSSEESAELKASVRKGYVLHGGPSVSELVEKLESVNPRIDADNLKNSGYNALIVTGENSEEAVKNLATLQEGVEKSEIDINT